MSCPTYPGGFVLQRQDRIKLPDDDLYDGPLQVDVYVPSEASDKEPSFCALVWDEIEIFVRLDVLTSFFSRSALERQWAALHAPTERSGMVAPFFIWDKDGEQYEKDTPLWIDPSGTPFNADQGLWVEKQLARWREVMEDMLLAARGGFFGRYLNPFKQDKKKSHDDNLEIGVNTLKTILSPVLQRRINGGTDNIMSYRAADARKFRCIGTDLFGYYCTWIDPTKYESMWKTFGVSQLGLAWPDETTAETANGHFKTDTNQPNGDDKEKNSSVLSVPITMAKLEAMSRWKKSKEGKTRKPNQDQVMGKSASAIASTFWGGGAKHEVEWLHRSGYQFGGLQDDFAPQSSQSKKNLVFGTAQSNTDMFRAESAVDDYIRRYAKLEGDQVESARISGTLKTVNKLTGMVSRSKTDGSKDVAKPIENWVKERSYSWLSFKLEFTWTMNPPRGRKRRNRLLPFSGSTWFDPLSRYRPMLIEAQLDEALIDFLFNGPPTSEFDCGLLVDSSDEPDAIMSAISNSNAYARSSKAVPLFGRSDLPATLVTYTIRNPRTEADRAKVAEIATLTDPSRSLSLAAVFPALAGSLFESISFRDCTFLHQNFEYDDGLGIGWHMSGTWIIDSSSGASQQLLKNVFDVEQKTLSVYAGLGLKAGWERVLDVHSFVLEGNFGGLGNSPPGIDWMRITSIGVRLLGIRSMDFYPEPTSSVRYGFDVFGTINFDFPGSVTPLEFNYNITEYDGSISVCTDIVGNLWEHALGIEGLTLKNVELTTGFALSSPWTSATFDVSAVFQFQSTSFLLLGSYASKTDFSLTSSISHFDLNTIGDLYEHMTKKRLVLPEVDITIGSATVSITSAKSLIVVLQDVEVNGHTSANAILTISPSGVALRGDLTSSSITLADIELKKAFLQIQFAPASSPLKTDVSLGGEIAFSGLNFDAAVHLYKDKKGHQWTVFAALTANNATLALKKLLPEVTGTCLEHVALRQVAFVAASKDDPYLAENCVPEEYEIQQGVQVWATIVTIDAIHKMARHDVDDLVLGATWSKSSGFTFSITIPSPIHFNLRTGVRTEPIKIEIHTKPVELVVSAGLSVQVPGSDWLTFSLLFGAGITEARIAAAMEGNWKNPLGISSDVSVSEVGLQVHIIYAQFFSTGIPSGFGIKGGLAIGDTSVSLALNVDEDPTKELLSAQASNLRLTDLVTFARKVTQRSIPYPSNILNFSSLNIYICMGGVWIGWKYYPPGFAFSANGRIFGNDFALSCSIKSGDVSFHASTSRFNLWAVTLRDSSLDGALGPTRQYLKIQGTVSVNLWITTVNVSAYFYIQLNPAFNISFHCSISFGSYSSVAAGALTTVQTVELTGRPVGTVTPENAEGAQIVLTGHFDDGLVLRLQDQVHRLFDMARRFDEEGKASLRASLDKEKENIDERLQQAHEYVEVADAAWQRRREAVVSNAEGEIAEYDFDLSVLQQSYNEAWHRFNAALDEANLRVQAKEYERVVRVRDAQNKVKAMEREMNLRVVEAVRLHEEARKDMFRRYGDAPLDLEKARAKAFKLRDEYAEMKSEMDGINQQTIPDESWMRARARQVHDVASSVKYRETLALANVEDAASAIDSKEYKDMQTVVDNAQYLSLGLQNGVVNEIEAPRTYLRSIVEETDKAVADAHVLLTSVQTGEARGGLEKALVDLVDFRKTSDARYNKAHETIQNVEQLSEFAHTKDVRAGLAKIYGELADLQGIYMAYEWIDAMDDPERGLGKWMSGRPTAFSISDVRLEGDMAFFGTDGAPSKPLKATVKTKVLGVEHVVNSIWSPDKAATFTSDIFKSVWGEFSRARARA